MVAVTRETRALRLRAFVLFGAVVLLSLAHVWLSRDVTGRPGLTYSLDLEPGDLVGAFAPAAIGLWLVWLRPTHPIGHLLLACGLSLAVVNAGEMYGAHGLVVPGSALPFPEAVLSLAAPWWIPAVFVPVTVLLVRYPSGEVTGTWQRRADRLALASYLPLYVGYVTNASSVSDTVEAARPPWLLPAPVSEALAVAGAAMLATAVVWIVGDALRRVVRGPVDERPALLLLLLSTVVLVAVIFLVPYEWTADVSFLLVLLAVAVGVWRYQALGVEVVVRRALVYAILTGLVLLVLLGSTVALAELSGGRPLASLVAAVVVALGLGPARDRVQRLVDRMVYGLRDDPWAALARLRAPGGASLLPDVLASLASGLRLPWARVDGPDGQPVALWQPADSPEGGSVPLALAGVEVGVLRLGARRGEGALSAADLRLLEAVAPLVAAVIEAERLAAGVLAERGRLRQDLHDGLGPSLTGIGLGLEALETRGADPALLARLRTEVASSLEETRRIIDDLRPTALDRRDLAGAIRHRAAQVSPALEVRLDLPASTPPLDPDVEKVAFRIVDEALTNVVRHAHASTCTVGLRLQGERLCLQVTDDGVGIGAGREDGVGMRSMRDRAAALGGSVAVRDLAPGTEVAVTLPTRAARPGVPLEVGS